MPIEIQHGESVQVARQHCTEQFQCLFGTQGFAAKTGLQAFLDRCVAAQIADIADGAPTRAGGGEAVGAAQRGE